MSITKKLFFSTYTALLSTTMLFAQTDSEGIEIINDDSEFNRCLPQEEVDIMTDEQIEKLELPLCNEEIISEEEVEQIIVEE